MRIASPSFDGFGARLGNCTRSLILTAILLIGASLPRVVWAQLCADNTVCPVNQGPSIQVWAAVTSPTSLTLTIYASDDQRLNMSSWQLWKNGVDATAWIGTAGVVDDQGNLHTSVAATGTMALSGSAWLKSRICDENSTPVCAIDSVLVVYVAPPPPPAKAAPQAIQAQRYDARLIDDCATCATGTAAYSTPAFFANGRPHATTLRYSSELSNPTGYVEIDAKVTAATKPVRMEIRLKTPGGSFRTLTSGGTRAIVRGDTAVTIRMAAQYDPGTDTTGVYLHDVHLTAYYGDSASPSDTLTTVHSGVRVLVQNDTIRPYGRGWTVAGDERLRVVDANRSVLLTDGNGAMQFWYSYGCGGSPWACAYQAPTGEFSTLARKVKSGTDTVWTRTARDGTVTEWNNMGLMRSVTDRWGNTLVVERMASGDLRRIYRLKYETVVGATPVIRYTTFAYSGTTGKLTSITLPDGRVSTFTVTSGTGGTLTSVVDPDGVTALTAGYSAGRLTTIAGRNAAVDSLFYDSYGQLSRRAGPAVAIDGGSTANESVVVSSLRAKLLQGNATTTGVTAPAPVRADSGAYLAITDDIGTVTRVWSHVSGAAARTRTTGATGKVDSAVVLFNATHQPTRVLSTGSAGTEFEWNGAVLASSLDLATGMLTQRWYTTFDQVDSVRVNGVRQLRNYFSGARLAPDSMRTDTANVTHFKYDARGRTLSIRDANGAKDSLAYETTHANVATAIRTATGVSTATTSITYDAAGRPLTTTDPLGRSYTTLRDALNRDTSFAAPLAATTKWRYNDVAGKYTLIDPILQTDTTVVNARGWVTRRHDARGKVDSLWYDRLGRVTRTRSRRGDVLTFSYDAFGRLLTRTDSAPGQAKGTTTFAYDSLKRWTAVQNAESIDTFFVDAGRRAVSATAIRSGRRFRFLQTYTQSTLPNLTTVMDSTGGLVWADTTGTGYNYYRNDLIVMDFAGKLTTVLEDRSGREIRDTLPTSTTSASKVRKSLAYNAASQLTSETFSGSPGATQNRTYGGYDLLDRIGTIVRPTATTAVTRYHQYDALGRLTFYEDVQDQIIGWDYTWDELHQEWDSLPYWYPVSVNASSYTYDKVANRTDRGAVMTAGNRVDLVDGWAITYDDVGNITKRKKGTDSLTYTWNALGQLVQVASSVPAYTVAYGYDGLGRRVRKTVNGTATRYLVDGDRVLVELDNAWAPVAKYSYYPGIDRPHAMIRGGKRYYYTQDLQGNVTGLLDSVGTVVQQYEYTPYGEALAGAGSVVNPYQYKGREWDAEARLYFMRARYYDPLLGRFISEDPIGFAGGMNPTAFVGGDPANLFDPSGMKECERAQLEHGWKNVHGPDGSIECMSQTSLGGVTVWGRVSPVASPFGLLGNSGGLSSDAFEALRTMRESLALSPKELLCTVMKLNPGVLASGVSFSAFGHGWGLGVYASDREVGIYTRRINAFGPELGPSWNNEISSSPEAFFGKSYEVQVLSRNVAVNRSGATYGISPLTELPGFQWGHIGTSTTTRGSRPISSCQ